MCVADIQTAKIGVAIERYHLTTGNLPNTLGDLVPTYLDTIPKDLFDGKDLRYKKLDIGFIVYSVGEDGHDDGGTEKRRIASSTYDITFTVQR